MFFDPFLLACWTRILRICSYLASGGKQLYLWIPIARESFWLPLFQEGLFSASLRRCLDSLIHKPNAITVISKWLAYYSYTISLLRTVWGILRRLWLGLVCVNHICDFCWRLFCILGNCCCLQCADTPHPPICVSSKLLADIANHASPELLALRYHKV